MSDRELLELAAKAAGIDLHVEWTDEGPTGRYRIGCDGDTWNPLTDDGDALRLAVACGIGVQCHVDEHGEGYALASWGNDEECQVAIAIPADDDKNAATRRTIVRAAAEIGRHVP